MVSGSKAYDHASIVNARGVGVVHTVVTYRHVSWLYLPMDGAPFYNAQGHMEDRMCPGARRLGAGAPLTVLWFSPLVRLRLVLGFHAIYCVCARFIQEECNL